MVHGLDNVLKKDYILALPTKPHLHDQQNFMFTVPMNTSRRTHGKTSSGNTLVTHTHRRYSLTKAYMSLSSVASPTCSSFHHRRHKQWLPHAGQARIGHRISLRGRTRFGEYNSMVPDVNKFTPE
jgi:hypothetical protein